MSFKGYYIPLGFSLGQDPPNLARFILIQQDVEGVDLKKGSLSLDLLNVDPDIVGNFEFFLIRQIWLGLY